MRNRPKIEKTPEQKFIENAVDNIHSVSVFKNDLHFLVHNTKWPIINQNPTPSFAEGSELKKPILLYLNEIEWNSIDRHTKVLGISKQEWIRHAIYTLLEEEQNYFMNGKTTKETELKS